MARWKYDAATLLIATTAIATLTTTEAAAGEQGVVRLGRAAVAAVAPGMAADDDRPILLPVGRFAIGPAFDLSPNAANDADVAIDATAGLHVMLGESVTPVFGAELGYTYNGLGLHAFQIAGSVGIGNAFIFATYNPRLIVGDANDQLAVGMRNGITGHFLADLFTAEVGHQFVDIDGALRHDIRLMFGANPLGPIGLLLGLIG